MSESIYVRLSTIMDDLDRLARHVQPLEIQLAIEHLVDRLDALIDDTIGLTDAQPPDQREVLHHVGGNPDLCPVCLKEDCPHWQFLNAEEHR